ncbi:MAG: methyltransferase domain-containing protein [bacterium]|nr:methyltransferase domain-containing protein [bacterium]
MADTPPLYVPPDAVKFILFQRTQYLFFRRNPFMRRLASFLPRRLAYALETLFTKFDALVSLEARAAKKRIIELFSEEMHREYQELRSHLPERVAAILDVGCGIGGIDAFLAKHYEHSCPAIHLLDRTEMPHKVYYGIEKKASFYNSLALAKKFLVGNGVKEEQIITQEANDDNRISIDGRFDLVVSLISWGFHYPVSTYLDQVYEKMNPGGVLIIDVRRVPQHDSMEEIRKKFGNLEVIRAAGKHARVVARKT